MTPIPFISEPGYRYFWHIDRDVFYRLGATRYDVHVWSRNHRLWIPTVASHATVAKTCVPVAGTKPLDDWRPSWAVMGGAR